MARKTIIAKKYTYKNVNGKVERVGKPKVTDLGHNDWGKLRQTIMNKSAGTKGKNVAFKKYRRITVACKPRIDHFYQENKDGTYSRTYFSSKVIGR